MHPEYTERHKRNPYKLYFHTKKPVTLLSLFRENMEATTYDRKNTRNVALIKSTTTEPNFVDKVTKFDHKCKRNRRGSGVLLPLPYIVQTKATFQSFCLNYWLLRRSVFYAWVNSMWDIPFLFLEHTTHFSARIRIIIIVRYNKQYYSMVRYIFFEFVLIRPIGA